MLVALAAALIVGGATAAINYFGSKAARNAARVPISSVPGAYVPPPIAIGGNQVTGTTPLMSAEEMQNAQTWVNQIAESGIGEHFRDQVMQEMGAVGALLPDGSANPIVAEEVARRLEEYLGPEVTQAIERYDVTTTALAEGSATTDANGNVASVDTARTAELFAGQQAGFGQLSQQQTEEDLWGRNAVNVSMQGQIDRLDPQMLGQEYLDQYRAQGEADRIAYEEQARQNEYAFGRYERVGAEDRAAGIGMATDYLGQITGQEAALQDVIAGNAPSVAVLERQRALEQTQAANTSMAASARDPNAWRASLNANASAGGQAAYDAALIRAQEIATARGQLLGTTQLRGDLQDYYSQLYGTEVGAAGTYSALQSGDIAAMGQATGTYGQLELGAAQADQNARVSNQEVETRAMLEAQGQYDAYATERQRQGDAAALGYYDQAWGAISDQAQVDLAQQGIAATSANAYGSNVTGTLDANADRLLGVANTETAGYLQSISSGLGTFSTMGGMGGGGGAPSQGSNWGSGSQDKWSSMG